MRRKLIFSSLNDRGITPKLFPHCRNASRCRHTAKCIGVADVGRPARLPAKRVGSPMGTGVSQRIEYGSVAWVSPVASRCLSLRCHAGVSLYGNGRIIHISFGKNSPPHDTPRPRTLRPRTLRPRALRSCALCPFALRSQAFCRTLSGLSSLPARRAAVALGRRRGANADPRLCQCQCQCQYRPILFIERHGCSLPRQNLAEQL